MNVYNDDDNNNGGLEDCQRLQLTGKDIVMYMHDGTALYLCPKFHKDLA